MLDLGALPDSQKADIQIFNLPSAITNNEWHAWAKPRGKTMVQILLAGGAGGGGGGQTAPTAQLRGGGGGGGTAGLTRLVLPLFLLPDTLLVQVGKGGVGGAAAVAGSNGVASYVSCYPDNSTVTNIYGVSNAGNGGGAGAAGSGGAGGTAGAIATIATGPLAGCGQFTYIAGRAGTSGGSGIEGTAATIPTTSILMMGGTGGGGPDTNTNFAGGAVTAIANSYLSERRPIFAAAGSFNGSGGSWLSKPFWSWPGMGGGGSDLGTGGVGGNGVMGSGGGGGGGGTTGNSGGAGGNGFAIFISW